MLNDLEKKHSNIIKQFDEIISKKISLENDLKSKNYPDEKINNFTFSKLMILGENESEDKIKREILNETKYAQPAILLHCYLNFLKYKEEFNCNYPKNNDNDGIFFFGPSLGEIISLVAAGSLDLNQAGILLYNRGRFMQESCPKGIGSMLNIVGEVNKTIPIFEEFLDKYRKENIDGLVDINISSVMNKRLIVVSGRTESIEECAKFMKNKSIACRKLIVSAAFHSNLMLEGSIKFKEFLFDSRNDIRFNFPLVNILSTIDPQFVYLNNKMQNLNNDEFDIRVKNLLVEQFTKKVDIQGCIEKYVSLLNQRGDKDDTKIYDIVKRKFVELDEYI